MCRVRDSPSPVRSQAALYCEGPTLFSAHKGVHVTLNRKPLSKKTRFDVFRRDEFICQYCGNTPPAVVLEVDHFCAVKNGGDNDIDNLITSCFDCNRGKGATNMSVAPQSVVEKMESLREKEQQIKEFNKQIRAKRKRQDRQIESLSDILAEYKEHVFSDSFRESVRLNFIEVLTMEQMENAMHKACMKCGKPNEAVKYFCGICWNTIKGRGKH